MSDNRDHSEPKPTTPAEARKKVEKIDPAKLREHYRDELTETDAPKETE